MGSCDDDEEECECENESEREIGIRDLTSHFYRSVDNASEDKALSGHCRNL